MSATIITILAILIAIILFSALVRQTMRAERAEAALGRVETVIADEARSLRYFEVRDAINDNGEDR
ncbi:MULTISPECIES: hypothetical protein [Sphingomonas]|uniref:hypothetical protein n=1 Tax=Sphingomonas TaxID=13687 RepID=UPI000F7DCA61|nr:hypothetical protein [Sphingomonas sp. ABOLF]GLK19217.1 hypothetical protein GCM10017606_00430 [Microbacterium terregens]